MPFDRRAFLTSGLKVAGASALAHPLVRAALDTVDVGSVQRIATVPAPRIITRAQWGADESLVSGSPEFFDLHTLIVHHTVTDNKPDDPAATVRSILRGHTQRRGFDDIGYNFLVDHHGRVYEGRSARNGRHDGEDDSGRGVRGAHAAGHNTGTVGIALLGDFSSTGPTGAAIEGLLRTLSWKADRHGIDPLLRIHGHRDVGSTACPGDKFYAMLHSIRRQTALRIAEGFIGYRALDSDGGVHHFGGAIDGGSLPAGARGVDIANVTGTHAYWLLDHAGGVHTRAGAHFYGSVPWLRQKGQNIGRAPMAAIESTASGKGYWVLDEAGGVFPFGDAVFRGSVPGLRAEGRRIGRARIVDITRTPSGQGYWVLDEDGGVFPFGDAVFRGSVPGLRAGGQNIPRTPIVAMAATSTGKGYWCIDQAGGVFTFGDAGFFGSLPGLGIGTRAGPGVDLVAAPSDNGYVILTADGSVYTFGRAPFYGRPTGRRFVALAPVIRG